MGEKEGLPEWLPAGWSMELRLKKDGKTYKCYTDPSGDLKFYSKPEVLRHLKNVSTKCSASKETKRKSAKKSAKKQYVVKKVAAEGLPPGWVEEMRVRKSGGREQRADKYFIDPETGRAFRSMKEVLRHLETGDFNKSMLNSKDRGHVSAESSNDTSPLQAEGEEKRVLRSKASKQVLKDYALKAVAEVKGVKVTKIKALKDVDNRDMKSRVEGKVDRGPDGKTNEEAISQAFKSVTECEGATVPKSRTSENVVEDQVSEAVAESEGFEVPKSKKNEEVVKDQAFKSVVEGDENKIAESKEKKKVNEDQEMKAALEGVGERVPDSEGAGGERDGVSKSKIIEDVEYQDMKSGSKVSRKRKADKVLEKRKKENGVSKSTTDLASMKMDNVEKGPPVNESEKNGNMKVHHRNKKLNGESCTAMPRRTSKRLAGVKVDQLLELETDTRARQVVHKQLSEAVGDINKHQNDLNSSDKHIREAQIASASDKHIREARITSASGKHIRRRAQSPSAGKQQGLVLPHADNLNLSDKHVRETNTRACQIVDKKLSVTGNVIKHQTGLNSPRGAQVPNSVDKQIREAKISCAGKQQGPAAGYLNRSDKHIREAQILTASDGKQQGPLLLPAGYLPFSQDHVGALGTVCKQDEDIPRSACKRDEAVKVSLDSFCKDFFNDPSIEFAIKTLTDAIPVGDDRAQNLGCTPSNSNSASSPALTCGDLWTDPCFAFAVKTLTDEIPLQEASCMKTSFQQPLRLPEAPRPNSVSLTTVNSDSFPQVNHHTLTHFSATEIPWYRQQDLVTPAASRIHSANPEVQLCVTPSQRQP